MKLSNNEFLDFILERLEPINGITWGRMFGGFVVRRHHLPIRLIFGDELYFKVNDRNLGDCKLLNSEPFSYQKTGKTINISNWRVPVEVLEDTDILIDWALKAYHSAQDAANK
jgi:TfoX/Sxy family transcriptional regulator of competence genes